jgi:hypothetical protein
VAEVPRACEANPNVLHFWRRKVRQFGPWRSPARDGAGQHVEEQRRLQALITRGSSPALRKATEAGDRPSRWVRLFQLAFACRAGFLSLATKCNELRWSFPARRRVSSGLDARFSITGPAQMSASMDGTIC